MLVRRWRMVALWAGAVAIAALTGCGGSASGGTAVVAQVRGAAGVASISKSLLQHWMSVEAVLLNNEQPTAPVPKGLIPDPPLYRSCIAYLAITPTKLGETGAKPNSTQLRARCAQRYKDLQVLTLNTLITWYWTIDAGTAAGIRSNDQEVKHRFEEVSKRLFPHPGEFATYLERTGQTIPDMLFRSKVQLFEVKLAEKGAAIEKAAGKAAVIQFARRLPPGKQWAAKTSCSQGYVVSACKEYTGSEAPGVPN